MRRFHASLPCSWRRQFSASAADQVWLTDITEHRTDEGQLYLCAMKDVYSNRIVGYSIDSRMKSSLAVAALNHSTKIYCCSKRPVLHPPVGVSCPGMARASSVAVPNTLCRLQIAASIQQVTGLP
ncbi:hypothetical protein M2432_003899 [Mycobacterium sp. OTB74]|nr:hypothetical protein [Mycobacterium sp. OTB74]